MWIKIYQPAWNFFLSALGFEKIFCFFFISSNSIAEKKLTKTIVSSNIRSRAEALIWKSLWMDPKGKILLGCLLVLEIVCVRFVEFTHIL